MSPPSPITKDVKQKTGRSDNEQQGSSAKSEAMGKWPKAPAAHPTNLSKVEDFILFPEEMIAMHRLSDKGNEASALRERQLPRSSLSQQAAVQEAEAAQFRARSRDQTRFRRRFDAEDTTTHRVEDERCRGQELPAAPMPPRLNTPELEEPVGELWPHHLLLEKQAESYIALRKSQPDTVFCANEGKEIMCCNEASSRNRSQRKRVRHTKDRR